MVRGTITDLEIHNEPLFFANVVLKDSAVKVQTNFHGNFEIVDVAPGKYTLIISYLGYEPLEIPVEVKGREVVVVNRGMRALSMQPTDDTASLTGLE